MNIQMMDCTLRDGGFLNKWRFGDHVIESFIQEYQKTCIDFIECGYLEEGAEGEGTSKYYSFEDLPYAYSKSNLKNVVYMIDYGKFDVSAIPRCKESSVIGIRVAFHKKDIVEAAEFCKAIKEKGYKLFVQPMYTLGYSVDEFVELLSIINRINPYAFYIVDSFGDMWPSDCRQYIELATRYLKQDILLGFHFHDNYQQAISNAISVLTNKHIKHGVIMDTTLCGVGRGGGNLDILQLLGYMRVYNNEISIYPFLRVADLVLADYLRQFNQNSNIEYLISAYFHCHPNYAKYLKNELNLGYAEIFLVFSHFSDDYKSSYNEGYIEKLVGNESWRK